MVNDEILAWQPKSAHGPSVIVRTMTMIDDDDDDDDDDIYDDDDDDEDGANRAPT